VGPGRAHRVWLLFFFFLALASALVGACTEDRDVSVVRLDLGESIRALGSDDLEVASAAGNKLAAIGAPALPALSAALRQGPETVRIGIIEVLEEMGGEDIMPLLVGALDDPAEQVRADAAMALRTHGGPAVEQALVRALDDPSATVRQRAVVGCRSACRSVESVQALVRHALDDPAAPVGWAAVKRLEQLRAGGDQAVAGSVDAAVVASAPLGLDRPDAGQRVRAAVLLATAGDARAMPVLQAAAEQGDTRLRLQAIYALGVVGGAEAIPVLQTVRAEPAVAVYAHDALRRAAGRGVAGADAALAGYDGPQSPVPLPPPP